MVRLSLEIRTCWIGYSLRSAGVKKFHGRFIPKLAVCGQARGRFNRRYRGVGLPGAFPLPDHREGKAGRRSAERRRAGRPASGFVSAATMVNRGTERSVLSSRWCEPVLLFSCSSAGCFGMAFAVCLGLTMTTEW